MRGTVNEEEGGSELELCACSERRKVRVSFTAEQHGQTFKQSSRAIRERAQLVQNTEGDHSAEFPLHTADRS